jgi:hypothetical protein
MTDFFEGTKAQGWQQVPFDSIYAYDQFWFVQPVKEGNTFAIWNLKSGTVLELKDGQSCHDLINMEV